MKTNIEEFRYCFRNPDNSSVFHSELVAIREALNLALDNRTSDTWILTDIKSSIQFLKDWYNVLDMLGQDILLKLAALTQVSSIDANPDDLREAKTRNTDSTNTPFIEACKLVNWDFHYGLSSICERELKQHLNEHATKFQHVCNICQKAFTFKCNLKTHMRLHTGERPYKCTLCEKKFVQHVQLYRHVLTHREETK
ncbi:hypothetical protein TNCT_214261 [Trichonephila clavata]|uniref:C2H2-type domain-containing protein n=1 Tax=Trichonephila clavata TaxID=2740835 RepID=A0A8X6JN28_TRICU|nr:hypothetical protein TNCT_214261 [Trichonephila clavata]